MGSSRPLVTVIVPTYNRAALLAATIPTYLQPEVGELFLVDDASPDGTRAAAEALAAADPRVRYLRSERNLKQTHAKNLGIEAAAFPYVYFGDDDSLLAEGSLRFLLETAEATGAGIVGARAPYMAEGEAARPEAGDLGGSDGREALEVDWRTCHARFDLPLAAPVEAPFVHAAMLARTELAKSIRFDEGYDGNCYREETDFILRARQAGARIYFDSRAVQANLPRSAASGGAHGSAGSLLARKARYYRSSLRNNRRFLARHHAWLRERYPVPKSVFAAQAAFAGSIVAAMAKNGVGRIKRWLARSS